MSTTVTSQMMLFLADHRISLRPSGHLPSERERPVGSMMDRILALRRTRWIRLLITACLASLLEPRLQDKPCVPRLLTKVLQGQILKLEPSLRPIVTLIALSSRCSPQDEIGSTCNQLLLCGAAAASKRARLCSCGWEANKVASEDSTNCAFQECSQQAAVPTGGVNGWNGVVQRNK